MGAALGGADRECRSNRHDLVELALEAVRRVRLHELASEVAEPQRRSVHEVRAIRGAVGVETHGNAVEHDLAEASLSLLYVAEVVAALVLQERLELLVDVEPSNNVGRTLAGSGVDVVDHLPERGKNVRRIGDGVDRCLPVGLRSRIDAANSDGVVDQERERGKVTRRGRARPKLCNDEVLMRSGCALHILLDQVDNLLGARVLEELTVRDTERGDDFLRPVEDRSANDVVGEGRRVAAGVISVRRASNRSCADRNHKATASVALRVLLEELKRRVSEDYVVGQFFLVLLKSRGEELAKVGCAKICHVVYTSLVDRCLE